MSPPFTLQFEPATDRDIQTITHQLNRKPRGVVGIAARNSHGEPAVIVCHPLRRIGDIIEPFPTLYWLTDPDLCSAISHLERDGAIGQVEQAISRESTFRDALHADHDRYAVERWSLITETDRAAIAGTAIEHDLRTLGIGGMANRDAVKCLHMHVAQHLANVNAVGAWVMERLKRVNTSHDGF